MKIYEYIVRIKDEATNKLRSLANAGNSVKNSLLGAGRSVMGFGRQLGSVGGNIASFIGLNSALVRTLGPAALAATLALTGQHAISLAADLEQTTVGFEVMLGSAAKANEMVKNLRQFAKVTPFETTDLVKSTEILLGFGVAGEQIMPTIKMLGDVARGNAEKLRLVSLAYAQIQAAGRLMGQDLLQLVNAGFNPLQEISKKTGKSMAVLKKEMEDGKISAGMVTAAFRSATSEGGRFFNMMNRQSRTFSGILSTVKDEWSAMLLSLGQKLLPQAMVALNWFRSVLNDLTTRIDFGPLLTGFKDTWGLIKDVANIFGELLQMMGISTTQVNALQLMFSMLAFSMRTVFLPLRVLLTGIKLWVEMVGQAVVVTRGFGLILEGVFMQNFALIKIGFDQASKAFATGFEKVKNEIIAFATKEYKGYKDIFNSEPGPIQQLAGVDTGNAKSGKGGADSMFKDGIDKITGGGRQAVNVTINLDNLVGVQNFDVTNVKESVRDMSAMVTEGLLRVLNSANVAASQ